MALTGKTIGELELLQFPTNETLIPVEYIGDTYHITFSSITYNEGSYSQFVSEANAGVLTPGRFYLMRDYQTCYDQPNFDSNGSPIITGNYKTGTTEPLLLLATSTTGFSSTVYSTLYPNDKITYDITWDTTEVTNSPAKGRITERIDNNNNRADYDFRAVQFIRYEAFFSENYYDGTLSIDGVGNVVGIGTSFDTIFSVGSILGVQTTFNGLIGSFAYYEVTSITDGTNMTVTGATFYPVSNVLFSVGISAGQKSPYQCNITNPSYTSFTEYYTFNESDNFNTYLGDNTNFNTFILSNNVFLNGSYYNNTFGGNVIGNTFDDDMDSNTCGTYFQYNIITNDFDDNTVGPNFQRNFIECDMQGNNIVGNFLRNMIGDNDGFDFDYNKISWNFTDNFITMYDDDFRNNNIDENFNSNLVNYSFQNNTIGADFSNNRLLQNFDDNKISSYFFNNIVTSNFTTNVVNGEFYNNNIYSSIQSNEFGDVSYGNNFGDPLNIGIYNFDNNVVGGNLINNIFSGTVSSNIIGNNFQENNIGNNFSYNRIGSNFSTNIIGSEFGFGGSIYRGNIIGNGFSNNTIGEYFYDNTVGDNVVLNNIGDFFTNNKISYGMNNTTIIDLDNSYNCQNNNFETGYFSYNLTLTGGTGGNPILYSETNTNIVKDNIGNLYVTYLSGGTIVAETITI